MVNSTLNVHLPYITADLPGIGGTLRAQPEHFIVEEVPLYEPSEDGQHLFVNLTKVGLTTKEIQKRLAQLFEVDSENVGFAGMKDKFASTTQTFSIPLGFFKSGLIDEAAERIQRELPVTLHWAKLHNNKLKTGHLIGNRFRIVITELAQPLDVALQNAQVIGAKLKESGLPNFFGPQRFGLNGENVERGYDLLVNGRFIRDRWLRKFLVSSYQSYLCNNYLRQRVEMGAFQHLLQGDVAKKTDTGGIFTVEDLAEDQPRYERQEISFTAPLFGAKMRMAVDEAGELEAGILAESGVTDAHWKKVKTEGTRRLGRLLVPDLTINAALSTAEAGSEEPDAIAVEFFLPKGAFATTVLREFMKVDLSDIPESE